MGKPWAGSVQWFPPYRWAVGVSCFFPVKIWGFCAYRSLQRGVLTVYLLGLNREELEVTAELQPLYEKKQETREADF